jgi:hypothetical protein
MQTNIRVTDVPTGTTTDPNDKRHLGVEEHEASARALEAAEQKPAAIQSWHRAAIGHARAGNLPGVIAAIVRAEKLADHRDFAPDLERKSTAADAALEKAKANIAPFVTKKSTGDTAAAASAVTGPIERVGEDGDHSLEPALERDRDWKNSTAAADATKTNSTTPAERL